MNKTIAIGVLAIVLVVGGAWWTKTLQSTDADIIAQNGMHWHPTLMIYVNDEQIEIPQNVGIGAVHAPIHTHDDLPILHLEFGGVVTREDVKLKKFFEVWNKDFMEFGESVTMTVNGVESNALREYEMHDGDVIILRYTH